MQRSTFTAGCLTTLCSSVAMAAGTAINIDSPGGDTGASSFDWRGLTFVLDNQPGPAVNAEHRVVGDSNGDVSIFLEQPGKVSYRAVLDPSMTKPTEYNLGFRYGEDLSASTPAFSNMTGFFRRLEGGTEIVQQLLAGSDAGNPNSVFYGTTGRTAAGGSMMNQQFLNNVMFGADGNLNMLVDTDGTAETSVTAAGEPGSADFNIDLTPGGTPDPFFFNELILQVESFQGDVSFGDQFGETGQKFTFTNFNARTIPLPHPAAIAGVGLGVVALRRRR